MPRLATRVAVLLLLLAVVAMWAVGRTRARRARTAWTRPVAVAVVVLGDAEPAAVAALRRSLEAVGQRLAEIMVGEVPLGPGAGRLPASARELGVGPATAAEIGWLVAPAAPGR